MSSIMQEVRWGIIGCGDVTERKSGPAFDKVAGSRLVAVMRRDGAKAADYARRHGVAAWYDDAQKLIDDPAVNAVYVATPPGSHCDYSLRVAAAGKACYVEKPMARNHDECLRMVRTFAEKGVPLFVAYYRRGLERFIKACDLVNGGEIGEVTAVEYAFASAEAGVRREPKPWRMTAEEAGAGLFLDLGSHLLDVLDFIFGPLSVQGGQAQNQGAYDVEDLVVVNFATAKGVRGVGKWDFTAKNPQDVLIINGTRGKVELSCFGNSPVVLETAIGRTVFDLPNPENIQMPLIESIVAELLGRGKCPSTGVSGARTSAVMDAALVGYYGTRSDGFWRNPMEWPGRRK